MASIALLSFSLQSRNSSRRISFIAQNTNTISALEHYFHSKFGCNGLTQQRRGKNSLIESNVTAQKLEPILPATSPFAARLPNFHHRRFFRTKQSLGQHFLQDETTIQKIVEAFRDDASASSDSTNKVPRQRQKGEQSGNPIVEIGPGLGALTGPLLETFGTEKLQCIEIDGRAVELLEQSFPNLRVLKQDVLQTDYEELANETGGPLNVVGNLPYNITSKILMSLADAGGKGAVKSATVMVQWEAAQRILASNNSKDYGILSVILQLFAKCVVHFQVPPTVFDPHPTVNSALIGLRFLPPEQLHKRLEGISPFQLRRVLACVFQQRRKMMRKSLKKLLIPLCDGDIDATNKILNSKPLPLTDYACQARSVGDVVAAKQELPTNWAVLRPEQLSPGQLLEVSRLINCHTPIK